MNGGKRLTDMIEEKAAKARQLRAAGIDIEQQRAMSEHEAAEAEEEDHVRRVGGRPLNGTAHANGATRPPPAPGEFDAATDEEFDAMTDGATKAVIREGIRELARGKKMSRLRRAMPRYPEDGDGDDGGGA